MAVYHTRQQKSTDFTYSGDTFSDIVNSGNQNYGGALYISGTASGSIEATMFSGNTLTETGASARFGGAIAFHSSGTLTITNSIFDHNADIQTTGKGGGGALYSDNGVVTISGSTFSGNSSKHGGGIYNNGSTMTITDTCFEDNQNSGGVGAAIRNAQGNLYIGGSTFHNNNIYNQKDIYVTGKLLFETASDNISQENTARLILMGESIFTGADAAAEVVKVIDFAGPGKLSGGTLSATEGYAAFCSKIDGDVYLYNGEAVVVNGVVTNEGTTQLVTLGGTTYFGDAYASLSDVQTGCGTLAGTSVVTKNYTADGNYSGNPVKTLGSGINLLLGEGTEFSHYVSNDGGVFGYINGGQTISADGVVFSGNSSTRGGVFFALQDAVLTFRNTAFRNNIGTNSGGALYVRGNKGNGVLVLDNVVFDGNSSPYGGAICLREGSAGNYFTVYVDGLITLKTATDTIYNDGEAFIVRTGNFGLTPGDDNIYTKVVDAAGSAFLTGNGFISDNAAYGLVSDTDYDCYLVAQDRTDYTSAAIFSRDGLTCNVRADGTLYAGFGYTNYTTAAAKGLPVVVTDYLSDGATASLNCTTQTIFTSSVIFKNGSGNYHGGAMTVTNGNTVKIFGATFSGNTASLDGKLGGAVYAQETPYWRSKEDSLTATAPDKAERFISIRMPRLPSAERHSAGTMRPLPDPRFGSVKIAQGSPSAMSYLTETSAATGHFM